MHVHDLMQPNIKTQTRGNINDFTAHQYHAPSLGLVKKFK